MFSFAEESLPWGVTFVITKPDECLVRTGVDKIRFRSAVHLDIESIHEGLEIVIPVSLMFIDVVAEPLYSSLANHLVCPLA